MTKLGDMFHIPVTDRINKRRPCVQKTIGRLGTLFCHFLLILVQAPAARARERSARRGQPPAAAEQEEPQPPTHLPPSRRSSLPRPSWPGPLFFKSVNVAHQYRCSSSWMCGFVCLWCLCGACTRKCGGAAHAASEHYCCCHCCRCCRRVTIICRRHQNACGGGPTLCRWCW
jgi:hypothetical protein